MPKLAELYIIFNDSNENGHVNSCIQNSNDSKKEAGKTAIVSYLIFWFNLFLRYFDGHYLKAWSSQELQEVRSSDDEVHAADNLR